MTLLCLYHLRNELPHSKLTGYPQLTAKRKRSKLRGIYPPRLKFFQPEHFDLLTEGNFLKKIEETIPPQEADAFGVQLGGKPGPTLEFPWLVIDDDFNRHFMEIQSFFAANPKGEDVLSFINIQTGGLS